MAAFIPNDGELRALEHVATDWNANDLTIRAFQNDYTPVAGSLVGDFTEATFKGYLAVATNAWDAPTTNGAGAAQTQHAEVLFTYDSGEAGDASNTIYGIYAEDSAGNLMFAERFASPVTISEDGNYIGYTPTYTLQEKTEACA